MATQKAWRRFMVTLVAAGLTAVGPNAMAGNGSIDECCLCQSAWADYDHGCPPCAPSGSSKQVGAFDLLTKMFHLDKCGGRNSGCDATSCDETPCDAGTPCDCADVSVMQAHPHPKPKSSAGMSHSKSNVTASQVPVPPPHTAAPAPGKTPASLPQRIPMPPNNTMQPRDLPVPGPTRSLPNALPQPNPEDARVNPFLDDQSRAAPRRANPVANEPQRSYPSKGRQPLRDPEPAPEPTIQPASYFE